MNNDNNDNIPHLYLSFHKTMSVQNFTKDIIVGITNIGIFLVIFLSTMTTTDFLTGHYNINNVFYEYSMLIGICIVYSTIMMAIVTLLILPFAKYISDLFNKNREENSCPDN